MKQRIGGIAGADLIFALNQEDAVEIAKRRVTEATDRLDLTNPPITGYPES